MQKALKIQILSEISTCTNAQQYLGVYTLFAYPQRGSIGCRKI